MAAESFCFGVCKRESPSFTGLEETAAMKPVPPLQKPTRPEGQWPAGAEGSLWQDTDAPVLQPREDGLCRPGGPGKPSPSQNTDGTAW